MASPKKRGDKWRIQIAKKIDGKLIRKSGSFSTKAEANEWAAKTETELLTTKRGQIPDKPFSALLNRYASEVSPKKRGERWEKVRLQAIGQMDIGAVPLPDLNATHFAKWRDDRLKVVKESTVNRDWNLLSNVCTVARDEWRWLHDNPLSKVKRPKDGPPRDKLINEDEIERILFACGYDYETTPTSISARVGAAFLFAIETAMRAGEIASLGKDQVNYELRVAKLLQTKNGDKRDVPLSSEAIRILKQLPESDALFDLTPAQIDANFRRAKSFAMIENLTFHDTRHLAITRLSKKLDVRELARMTGHRDLRKLMIYFNEPASETAKKLD